MSKKIVLVVPILYILLFTYAAISKLTDYHKFTIQLSQSPLLTKFVSLVAWLVPGIEMLIVVLLITERYRRAGLFISIGLMSMFTTYIIVITQFSIYIPCSCGGVLQNMSWNTHLLFNIVFLLLGIVAILVDDVPGVSPSQIIGMEKNPQNKLQRFSL